MAVPKVLKLTKRKSGGDSVIEVSAFGGSMNRQMGVLLLAVAGLAACSVNTARFQPDATTATLLGLRPLVAVPGELVEPQVGTKASAAVGMPMASSRTANLSQYFLIEGTPTASWDDGKDFSYTVSPTTGKFRVAYSDVNGVLYLEESRATVQRSYQGSPNGASVVRAMYRIDQAEKAHLVMRGMDSTEVMMKPLSGIRLTRKTEGGPVATREFRRELIYTGRAGSAISLMYREYSDDMARPAFSQQLQYDLTQDPVIGYQGARFKVLSATNTEVTYEVLSTLSAR